MLIGYFQAVREAKVPATLREFLDLLEALKCHQAFADMDDFYYLSRLCLVKDEKYFDRFDLAFTAYFKGLSALDNVFETLIPDEWLRTQFENSLTEEEREKIKSLGGLEQLLEAFKQRLQEQDSRHSGGSKWIGTGGTSPFGANGYNPEGIRIGQDGNRNGSAVKVWEQREYRNFDDSVELGTRNIKVALRRLRDFARKGAQEELDLDDTIRATARNAGYLDLKMVPERHNAVKVLLFMDVGGSMDWHIRGVEELFSAARVEFKHLEYFYFHNFIYDQVWVDNRRRHEERIQLWDILHKYTSDYKVIFIGDASMSPYEIRSAGGSVEHWNKESGEAWFHRIAKAFPKMIWLNPSLQRSWEYTQSTAMIRHLIEDRMYPLTIKGLQEGMRYLSR